MLKKVLKKVGATWLCWHKAVHGTGVCKVKITHFLRPVIVSVLLRPSLALHAHLEVFSKPSFSRTLFLRNLSVVEEIATGEANSGKLVDYFGN